MDAGKQIQADAETITNLYSNLESRIFTEIIKVLQRGKYADVTADNVLQWQAKQLADAGMLFDGVIKLLAEYDHLDPDYIRQTLQDDGYQIMDEVSQELQEHGRPAQPISDDLTNTLDSAVRQTTDTLNNIINQTLLRRNLGVNPAMRAYQEILKRSTLATVSGLKTHEQAIKDAIYQQVERGIPILRDKAGRIWSIEGYTRTVLTTTANRIYNDLRTKRMQEMGQALCVMTSHPNSREACAYIQGHVVNVVPPEDPKFNGKYDSIYNHGYGTPAGTLGINCRHMLIPYTEGVNTNHQPQYDPEEAIKNGKLVQQQRARERAIRDAKKRLKAAKELGDEVMVNQAKTLLRARQAKLREFIKQTNADRKVPILTRDYSREKIITRGSKFRTAERELISEKSTRNEFSVNRKLVNTAEFHKRFNELPVRKAARESLYKQSIKMLEHRDGTAYEDIVAIDARTGKVIARNDTYEHRFQSGFTNADAQLLNTYPGRIILLHNHPGSTRPSSADLISLHKHNAVATAVVGHDGSIRLVKDDYRLVGIEAKYLKWYNYYRKDLVETQQLAEIHAMNQIYKEVPIYGTRFNQTR